MELGVLVRTNNLELDIHIVIKTTEYVVHGGSEYEL